MGTKDPSPWALIEANGGLFQGHIQPDIGVVKKKSIKIEEPVVAITGQKESRESWVGIG